MFCPEGDAVNKAILEQSGIEKLFIKPLLLNELKSCGWEIFNDNFVIVIVKPTPFGDIIKGYGIDGFPVCDSSFEYCTLIMNSL
jgi:hypothetical protein